MLVDGILSILKQQQKQCLWACHFKKLVVPLPLTANYVCYYGQIPTSLNAYSVREILSQISDICARFYKCMCVYLYLSLQWLDFSISALVICLAYTSSSPPLTRFHYLSVWIGAHLRWVIIIAKRLLSSAINVAGPAGRSMLQYSFTLSTVFSLICALKLLCGLCIWVSG